MPVLHHPYFHPVCLFLAIIDEKNDVFYIGGWYLIYVYSGSIANVTPALAAHKNLITKTATRIVENDE